MRYRTVRQVQYALHWRGGWLEIIRESRYPEYVPHLSATETQWPHGIFHRDELLKWANVHLQ